MKVEDADAIRRGRWVESYRLAHRGADRWADGSGTVRHSLETQERIFRMAEQLRASRDWPDGAPLFPLLKALDDAASWEIGPNRAPTPTSAAAAALVGFKILFGKLPPVQGHDWPDGCELAQQADAELATFGLRLDGFDPIVFDGTDPAAYVWALFEIRQRNAACDEGIDRGLKACRPRGLAVVATPPVRRAAPKPAPLPGSREPAELRS